MKLGIFFLLFLVALVNGYHTFLGTNVQRPLVHHEVAKYSSYVFRKRIEYFTFKLPNVSNLFPRFIQGILAYDLKNSEASANVTVGGIGTNNVTLRMKSERSEGLHYDIYIYA